ncbi:MAG: hypothetical protein AAF581_07140 [Planctomycetota bacterium]
MRKAREAVHARRQATGDGRDWPVLFSGVVALGATIVVGSALAYFSAYVQDVPEGSDRDDLFGSLLVLAAAVGFCQLIAVAATVRIYHALLIPRTLYRIMGHGLAVTLCGLCAFAIEFPRIHVLLYLLLLTLGLFVVGALLLVVHRRLLVDPADLI